MNEALKESSKTVLRFLPSTVVFLTTEVFENKLIGHSRSIIQKTIQRLSTTSNVFVLTNNTTCFCTELLGKALNQGLTYCLACHFSSRDFRTHSHFVHCVDSICTHCSSTGCLLECVYTFVNFFADVLSKVLKEITSFTEETTSDISDELVAKVFLETFAQAKLYVFRHCCVLDNRVKTSFHKACIQAGFLEQVGLHVVHPVLQLKMFALICTGNTAVVLYQIVQRVSS